MNSSTDAPRQQQHQKPLNNLEKYYEYRIYNGLYNNCPIVFMARHQGFEWNDELFVSQYRSQSIECHKSQCLKSGDELVRRQQQQQQSNSGSGVIDIHLTEADCDVWP